MKDIAALQAELVERLTAETADLPARRAVAHIDRVLTHTPWLGVLRQPDVLRRVLVRRDSLIAETKLVRQQDMAAELQAAYDEAWEEACRQ
jgi:hypothetical protein